MNHKWTTDIDGLIHCELCHEYLTLDYDKGELIITECKKKPIWEREQ